ncbi:hypothetical protein DBR47_17335 [Paucibacter sp. KBW04]|uniref:protein kinase domain-containing protein n=1 Tax=Paucibacter sp. KBW04 TaxID=2153361 RepID=UPI000F5806C3|nr:protein kinase [Paucibacter sp. KBW04]RQO56299.1 hypothetical protein DBR47_17335 [Paucibacter sp. KBW04]
MSAPAASPDPLEEHAQLKALFNELCELPDEAAQNARLDELKTAPLLKLRLLRMLAQEAGEGSRFARPLLETLAKGPELRVGDAVGAWRLVSVLGHGGMGQVYLAERSDGHYQQLAALKLLRGFSAEEALAQLARERQILAGLNHPNIARLIDGGTTPGGRPYLVMDYVQGESMLRYALRQRLSLRELLRLFGMVCDAVAYAHRQLILHCDIKPSNVLVGLDGRAMLLDFGVAQLQGKDGQAGSDTLAATPRYASPEQLAGRPASSASDIYSLGRLLQELLTHTSHLARLRAPRRHELQALLAKACHPDPEQRYLSVPELQADLNGFVLHKPLAALPGGRLYAAQKFLRRHWAGALITAAALLLSAGFAWRMMQERDRAERERDKAAAAQKAAHQVSDFMLTMFVSKDPSYDLPASQLLAEAQEQLEHGLGEQPEVQAKLYLSLGIVQKNRGELRTARQLLERGIEIERQNPLQPNLGSMLYQLAVTHRLSDDFALGLAPALETLALRRKTEPPDSQLIANASALAGYLKASTGALSEGRQWLEASLQVAEKNRPRSHSHALSLSYLALLRQQTRDFAAAQALTEQALAIRREIDGEDHPRTLTVSEDLALIKSHGGQAAEAQRLLQACIAKRIEQRGARHLALARSWDYLGQVQLALNQPAQAQQSLQKALQLYQSLGSQDSGSYQLSLQHLAQAQLQQGQAETALSQLKRFFDYAERHFLPQQASYQQGLILRGQALLRTRAWDAAEQDFGRAAQLAEASAGPLSFEALSARLGLAELRLAQGRKEAARQALQSWPPPLQTSPGLAEAALQTRLQTLQKALGPR